MYTLEELKKENPTNHHLIDDGILKKVNEIIDFIKPTDELKVLDAVDYINENGAYYSCAGIERIVDDKKIVICESAGTHISGIESGKIYHSTSGGTFPTIPINIEKIGTIKRSFWTWGNMGASANGGVYFKAEVSLWQYNENKFPYSEKYRDKKYFYYSKKPEKNYVWYGDGIAFENDEELINYLFENRADVTQLWKGSKSFYAWLWKTKTILQNDKDTYDNTKAEEFILKRNGEVIAKREYKDSCETIIHYLAKHKTEKIERWGLPVDRIVGGNKIPEEKYNEYLNFLYEIKKGE